LELLAIGWSIGYWITFAVGRLEHSFSFFFFHNSITRPPPFFSFLLTTMPHGSNTVTMSLHCVGSPSVAVLCESDCPSSAWVVQLERKKKKRVSVIVGNDHQSPPINDYHSPQSHDYHLPPSHNHHLPPTNAIQSRTNANRSPPTLINRQLPTIIKSRLSAIINCHRRPRPTILDRHPRIRRPTLFNRQPKLFNR
jgi:hypothetical protein